SRLFCTTSYIDVFHDLEIEAGNTVHLLRRRQYSHALQAEVAQYLRADAVGLDNCFTPPPLRKVVGSLRQRFDCLHQLARGLLLAQYDDHAGVFSRDAFDGAVERPAERGTLHAQNVPERVLDVHAHEWPGSPGAVALGKRHMHRPVYAVVIAVHPELAVGGLHRLFGDSLDVALLLQPIANEVRNRAYAHTVLAREGFEVRPARHAAVFVEDFNDSGSRFKAGEPRQVAARLRVPGAREYAAWLRHDGEDVPGLAKMLRARIGRYGNLHGAGAVVRRNTGGDALGCLDGDREVGRVPAIGIVHHQRKAQLP